jgi:hypothetical protein
VTREAVVRVVQRAISDGSFRTQLTRDAASALRGFDLTPAEIAAIKSGDSGRISALGVDLRMSKAFTIGASDGSRDSVLTTGTDSSLASGVNSGVNSAMTSGVDSSGASTVNSSLTTGTDSSLAAGVNSGTNSALTGGVNSSANAVDTIDSGAGGTDAAATGESQGTQVVQWDGNDDAPLSTVIPGEPAHAFGAQTPEGNAFGDNTLTAGDEGYLTSVNVMTGQESASQNAAGSGFATDEGQLTNSLNSAAEGGAGTPGEPEDGPNLTP